MISFKLYCENQENTQAPEYYNFDFIMAPSKVLGLNNTLDIPKLPPYGFWVNKFGHWVEVPFEGHSSTAESIMRLFNENQPDPKKQFDRNDLLSPYSVFYANGYIRMVNDNTVFLWEHNSRGFKPSESQLKFFREINMQYHMGVERDPYAPKP